MRDPEPVAPEQTEAVLSAPPVDTARFATTNSQGHTAAVDRHSPFEHGNKNPPSPARHFWRSVGRLVLFFAGVQLASGVLYAIATWLGNSFFSWSSFLTVGAVASGVIGGAMLVFFAVMGILWNIRRKRHLNEFRAVPTPARLLRSKRRWRNSAIMLLLLLLLIFMSLAFLLFGGLYALIAWLASWAITWATFSLVGGIGAVVALVALLVFLIVVAKRMEQQLPKKVRPT